MEALEAAEPDPPDPNHQGRQPSLGKHVTNGAKSYILHFPIIHFKAEPAKPFEVKPRRVKNVKAEKGKGEWTTSQITFKNSRYDQI